MGLLSGLESLGNDCHHNTFTHNCHADNQNNDETEYNTHTKQSQKSTLPKHSSNCHICILKTEPSKSFRQTQWLWKIPSIQKKSKHSPDFNTWDYNETRLKVQFTENDFYGRIRKKFFTEYNKNDNYKLDTYQHSGNWFYSADCFSYIKKSYTAKDFWMSDYSYFCYIYCWSVT